MRISLLLTAPAFALACLGCNRPTSAPVAAEQRAYVPRASVTSPSWVVYTVGDRGRLRVAATIEDGTGAPIMLSPAGIDASFVAELPGRRALIAERRDDGSIARLAATPVDSVEHQVMAELPAGSYEDVRSARLDGDAIVLELARRGGAVSDVLALRAGQSPVVLARAAKLVALALGRAAVLGEAGLRSLQLDGSQPIALGTGAGDRVAAVHGDRLLLTVAGGHGDVRSVRIDGSAAVSLGRAELTETGFDFGERIVFVRQPAAGAVLLSVALDGSDERVLAPAGATPLLLTDRGVVIYRTAAGALVAVAATGGAATTLDPAAPGAHVARVTADHVLYTADAGAALSLRAAWLDGRGVAVLCEKARWLPTVTALLPGDRVLFHRALAGSPEGGAVYSVGLDGRDLRPVGTEVVIEGNGDGDGARPRGPADQDFEAVTPAGRIILETEFESAPGAVLVTVGAHGETTRSLTAFSSVRFAGLIR